MATGDIVSVVIDSEGWFATIGIEGFATGAVYNFALTGENVPSSNTPYFTVVSEGYNSSGVLGTMTRTVHVGIQLRKVHPNEAQIDETVTGGVMYFKVPLEEFVYSGDKTGAGNSGTAPTFTAPSGWVTSGGTPSNSATAIAVTNNSTNPYPVPIANWTMPGGERLSTKAVACSAIGFHASGRDQKPLACIKFVATAPGGYSASTTVANSEIVAGTGDALPIIEYKGTIDLTSFPDDVVVTTNFIAYPIFGDTPYDSTSGSSTAALNHFTSPLEWYLDIDESYGFPICVVESSAGAGSGAVFATDDSTNRTNALANPYPTIAKAIAGLSAYLSANKGRDTVDGATIYLAGGVPHQLIAGTEADGVPKSTGNCYLTFKPYPTHTVSLAVGTNKIIPAKKIKFEGLTFSRSADGAFVDCDDVSSLYLLNCGVNDSRGSISTSAAFSNTTDCWIVRGTLTKVPGPTANYRGCSIPQGGNLGRRRLILGTSWKRFGTISSLFSASTNSTNTADGFICAFNKFLDCTKGVVDYPGVGTGTFAQGCASVQNLMEYVSGGGDRLMRLAADGNNNVTYNCVIAHNTAVGELCNAFYNDVPADRHVHLGHTIVLNATESFASKGDTFADDARCTGNWPVHMGCGVKGNRVGGGNFPNYFRGFYSSAGTGDFGDPTRLNFGFINNVSSSGSALGGTGNYRPNNTSILKAVAAPQMLKWDLDGNERALTDAAGAFKYTLIPEPPSAPTNLRLTLSTNIFDEDFELGSLPAGYTVDSTGTGTNWNFTPALTGTKSVRVSGSTTGTLRGFTTPTIAFPDAGLTWMAYFTFKFDVAPTGGNGRFFEVLRASDGLISQIGQVIVTTNELRLANGSGVSGTGAYVLTVGNTYHMWLKRMADGALQGWVATTDTFPGGAAMLNGSASVNPGAAGKLHFGGARSMAMVIDKLRVAPTDIGSAPA